MQRQRLLFCNEDKMMVRKKESDIYGSEEKAGDRGEPAL